MWITPKDFAYSIIGGAGLAGKHELPFGKNQNAALSDEDYFSINFQGEDANVVLTAYPTPNDEVACDENLRVDLNLTVEDEGGRAPLDMMLVLDRTLTMGDCVVADGNAITTDVLTTTLGWSLAKTFTISAPSSFDVLIEWLSACALGNCPKMYIESPTGKKYGFGYSAKNSSDCYLLDFVNYYEETTYSYIAMPSNISEAGLWKVYVKKNDPQTNYAITIKAIASPKAKLESMKETSVNFIYNAEWQPSDQIGYVSFERRAKKESPLPSFRNAVANKIWNTTKSGEEKTAMGDGIHVANDELTGVQGQEGALRFEILLSDGQNTIGVGSADGQYKIDSAELSHLKGANVTIGDDMNQSAAVCPTQAIKIEKLD